MVQWWYGHNAVGFFLTTGFLGMMYYFVTKQVGKPIYSYRLSIVHFWALITLYIWAGPHHLHYTALRPGLQKDLRQLGVLAAQGDHQAVQVQCGVTRWEIQGDDNRSLAEIGRAHV